MNTRLFLTISATSLALLSAAASAADAPKAQPSAPMKCMAGKEMQCDMTMQMGGMKDRMANMQQAMERCAKGETHCDKQTMTNAMKDMQDHMDQMMKNMMAMPDDQQGASGMAKPAQPEDHAQHHKDAPQNAPAPK